MSEKKRRVRGWKICKQFWGGQPCVKCGSTDYEYRHFMLASYKLLPKKKGRGIIGGVICDHCYIEPVFVKKPPKYYRG
jgi:hypothetical protein